MSNNSARQWTPPPGRHQVSVGKSMSSFLKQRKGIQQPKLSKAMPTSSYFHFNYNFSPESVDTTKPGVLELTNNKDLTSVHVERANKQGDDSRVHVFSGKEEPAKEVECVLIYDEDSGTYTLEKLDSSLILQYGGRKLPKARHPSASPMASPSPAASTSKIDEETQNEIYRELEKARTYGTEDEAAVESDTPLSTAVQTKVAKTAALPKRPPPVFMNKGKPAPRLRNSPATTPAPAKPARSPLGTSTPSIPPAQPAPSAPAKATPKIPEKRKAPAPEAVADGDVEELEFGMPTKVTRTSITPPAVSAPPQASAMELSLPGSSNSGGIVLPGHQPASAAPPNPPDEEEEEEEWDEVAVNNADTQANEMDKFAEEMELDLGMGLEEELNGEDDGEADDDDLFGDGAAETGGQEQAGASQGPISLNVYAGGEAIGLDDDDDDYSSSEDSDDD